MGTNVNSKVLLAGMIQQLGGDGICIGYRDINERNSNDGVLLSVVINTGRNEVSVPPELAGLSPYGRDSAEASAFCQAHGLKKATLGIAPKAEIVKLMSLGDRIRRTVKSFTADGEYILFSNYNEMREQFSDLRCQYLHQAEAIAANWDSYVAEFSAGLKALVSENISDADKAAQIQGQIIASIPSKKQFLSGCNVTLEVRPVPTNIDSVLSAASTAGCTDLQAELKETFKNDVVNRVVTTIEGAVTAVWSQACACYASYGAHRSIKSRQLAALEAAAERAIRNNVFSNPLLTRIGERFDGISQKSPDEAAEVIEQGIVDIVAYAKSVRLQLDMGICSVDDELMERMLRQRSLVEVPNLMPGKADPKSLPVTDGEETVLSVAV